MESTNHIEAVMSTALRNIKNIADVNTVIGKPFVSYDGTTIIPVSRVTVGILTGGGEYGTKEPELRSENYPFTGGSGAAVSLNPVGFLVKTDGEYKMVNVLASNAYEKLFDAAGTLLGKLVKDKPQ